MIELKSEVEIEALWRAGQVVAKIFEAIEPAVVAGVTTEQLDRMIRAEMLDAGAEPLFYNYRGFPGHSCISVNEEVVHGIPGSRQLEDRDIVTIDIGVRLDGFCGDSARTFFVGEPTTDAQRLVQACESALAAGIEACQPGDRISSVSRAIEEHTVESGFHVVTSYVGHGIGREMHEDPQVPNFVGEEPPDDDPVLEPGLVIAIEPMVTQGAPDVVTLEDGWTVTTVDGKLACHCEHTVAVTSAGPRILTALGSNGARSL